VQPNLHGFDNTVTLEAVANSDGRLIGVVKADASFSERTAEKWHDAGVRGVRFAFMRGHGGSFDMRHAERVVTCIAELGWFVQFHMAPEDLVELRSWLSRLSLPIVIDHLGRIRAAAGLDQPGFRALLDLQKSCGVWVRISGADRVSENGPPYDDVLPFVEAVLAADSSRVLWGSDWPHSGYFSDVQIPDDGELFDFLVRATGNEEMLRAVLVSNPERLISGRL
jgi:predicted TIM-barrel fold metal-dependent hydrolase